jgi:hypothetical protein
VYVVKADADTLSKDETAGGNACCGTTACGTTACGTPDEQALAPGS